MKISYYVKIDKVNESGELLYVVENNNDLEKEYSLNDLNNESVVNVVKLPYKKGYLNYGGKLKELLEVKEVLRDLKEKGFKSNGEKIYLVGYGISLENLLNKYQKNPEALIKNDLRVVKGYILNICGNFTDLVYVKSNSGYENNFAKFLLNKLEYKDSKNLLSVWMNSLSKERIVIDLNKFNKSVVNVETKETVIKEKVVKEFIVYENIPNIFNEELEEKNTFISFLYFNEEVKFKFIDEDLFYLNNLSAIKINVKFVEYKDSYYDFDKFYNMFKDIPEYIKYKNDNNFEDVYTF